MIASPDASGVSFVVDDDPLFDDKVVVSHGFGGGGVPTDIFKAAFWGKFSPFFPRNCGVVLDDRRTV